MSTEVLALFISALLLFNPADSRSVQNRRQKRQLAILGGLVAEELAALFAGSAAAVGTGTLLANTLQNTGTSTGTGTGTGVIKGDEHSKSCYNNRGWCRYMCQSNEKVAPGDHWPIFCGGDYDCCIDKDL